MEIEMAFDLFDNIEYRDPKVFYPWIKEQLKDDGKYYIQSAYLLETEEQTAQELRPLLKIQDSFKKIVITSNTPRPFYNEEGILMMSVYDFLLNAASLEI